MAKVGFFSRMKDVFDDLTGKNRFGKLDFAILRTMMMLTAVDGDVSPDEIANFRAVAAKCRGYSGESFEVLWDKAVRSAGYILLQSRLLGPEELASAFVKEAEPDFVGEVIQEVSKERERAFACLERMAAADGDYSESERACIAALAARVKEARDQAIAERYPRAVVCK